jgi:hypothetical protein
MARRAGAVAPSPACRDGAAQRHIAVNPHEPIKDTGAAAHLSQLGGARGRTRHGIQRLGRPAQSTRTRAKPGVHAHARGADGFHARAC